MPIDASIREIIKENGHIKIDDMMREVLTDNQNAYYRSIQNIGPEGDFITAPEISQLFGEVIALWAIEKWQEIGKPERFSLAEFGPGQGKLMQDFLRAAKVMPEFFAAANIFLLEINPNFVKKQKANLKDFGKKITWISKPQQLPPAPMILLANEFFDALPIKQYVKVKDKWFESIFVNDPIDGRIKYDKIELHKNMQNWMLTEHKNAKDGAILEESIESLDIMRFLGKHLAKNKGAALIIDYGYNIPPGIRSRNQYNSTLQAIKEHKYHSIISSLGEADLTAHVDFDALLQAAKEQDLKEHKFSTQKEFLLKYGIELRKEMLQKSAPPEERLILENQVFRLTDTKQMGELFKVLEVYNCG